MCSSAWGWWAAGEREIGGMRERDTVTEIEDDREREKVKRIRGWEMVRETEAKRDWS